MLRRGGRWQMRAKSAKPLPHDACTYIGGLVTIYAVATIIAILMTSETKSANLKS
jgi:hypothetical protein